uniref:RNA-directed DNA polymerase n=1 Tax=Strigamia maritima TaxID=126957 RepID=T1IR46_STRMM
MCDHAEGGDEYSMIVKFHPTFEKELNDSGAGFKAFIPSSLIRRIIFVCHGHPLSGHAGISKTLARAMQLYFWSRMRKDVRKYVRGCLHCQQYKPPNKRSRAAPYQPQSMRTHGRRYVSTSWDPNQWPTNKRSGSWSS